MRAGLLQPFNADEAIGTGQAAELAGKCERTIRNWCLEKQIGRRIGGRWMVSAVALDMVLADDLEALEAYLRGDRGDHVRGYFARRSILLPQSSAPAREPAAALN